MMQNLAILCVRGYQRFLRPFIPSRCIYTPSCSEYCIEAIRCKGVVIGIMKSAYRIFRYNPFAAGGHDPVE